MAAVTTLRGEAAVALPDGKEKNYAVALTLPAGVSAGGPHACAVLLLAGAGGGMDAPLLVALAEALAARTRLPVLRFECRGPAFDRRVLVANAVMRPRAACGLACARWVAVGTSLGARVAARLVADGAACAAAMLAFPLLSSTGESRLEQLLAAPRAAPAAPLLLARGERDTSAPPGPWAEALSVLSHAGATPLLHTIPGAGHSLDAPAATKDAERERLLAAVAAFVADAAQGGDATAQGAEAGAGAAADEQPAKRQRQ
jgi:predicted alpha/beta-hydrolase family hydrolase